MKRLAVVTLVLGSIVWGCGSSERPQGAGGGSGGTEDTGGSGSGGKGTGGASNTGGGSATGGSSATGGAPGTGGSTASTGGTSGGKDASASGTDGPPMSGGDQWAKCGPEAYKADVSAADFCARYISVCKASVSMDACMTQYNGLSDGPRRCRACTAYYACLAGSAEVMAMSCMYVMQGLAKAGPCKPSYCD